ncbi:MAG: polysaccharide biosynthesis C-terminal domain-containing protein [Nitrospirae bacterium]|nr:polysaccharide biosynthesis C-terminal domain-containing protein [Nitrospirota bacterium]
MSEVINSSLKSTAKGTILVFFGMVASILLWFATKVLIVRNITTEELGLYSIVIGAGGLVAAFAALGIQEGITRYVSIFLGRGEDVKAASIARIAVRVGFISAFISMLIHIGQPLSFLILLIFLFMFRISVLSISIAYSAAMFIVFVSLTVYYSNRIGLQAGHSVLDVSAGELLRFSVPLLIVNILGIVLTWCDTLMLGRYAPAEEAGIYNVAMTLAKLIIFPLAALEFVYMPAAGQMYAKGQKDELKKTYQILTKWVFSASLPIFFVLFFFPEMTISFIFDGRYAVSATSLRLLSACFMFHAFMGANVTLMIIMGRSGDLMRVSAYVTVLNIILNYILIKYMGLGNAGASAATLASYFAMNIIISFMLYRMSGIHPFTTQYVKPVISSAIIGLIVYAAAKSLPLYLWMMPLYLLLYLIGYFISLILTKSFEQQDIDMLDAISQKTGMELKMLKRIIYNSPKSSRVQ